MTCVVVETIFVFLRKDLKKEASMTQRINTSLEELLRNTPIGLPSTAIGTVFRGINHRQTPAPIPINKDQYGLIFFTRPQLNLSRENITTERFLGPLLTTQEASIQRIVRMYLDPRLGIVNPPLTSPFVDNKNAFMPLLTNHCISCTGWPDVLLDTYTSQPGTYREVYSQVDGIFKNYTAYDITATFRNMSGDPVTLLMLIWTFYAAAVFEGTLVPYPDFLVKNEVDYNTRIYRLVLDQNKRFVQKIACTGASYPINVPVGPAYNFEIENPINEANKEITIQFKSIGARYMDDLIVHDFNKVVGIFNPDMRLEDMTKSTVMKGIPHTDLQYFNNKGYPYIHPDTKELQWYIHKDEYEAVMVAKSKNENALIEASQPINREYL
jgi:hypothetical protein